MAENEITAIGFDHNNKHYVIKVIQVGNSIFVKSYHNGMEINSYSYPIELVSTNKKAWRNLYGNKQPYVRLVEIAEFDIKAGNGIRKDIKP